MKILLLFCLISLPMNAYTQFSANKNPNQELSAESKILIEQAKNKGAGSSKSKNSTQNAEGLNIAVTSSFTGGFMPDLGFSSHHDVIADLFNATSLEIYFPALASTPKTRFLMTARFFTPVLGDGIGNSMYLPRLGYGIGFSSMFFDGRNKNGQGWTGNINLLFAQDFNFLDRDAVNHYIDSAYVVSRIDLSMRWNYFIHRNFAVVFGLDFGGGFTYEEYHRQIDFYDGYPVEPLTPYGYGVTGIINIGLTVGFMF